MSIHPVYAEAIMRGDKRVEFRKLPIREDVTHVLVYATAPVGAVIGAFTVIGQDTTHPATLWQRFADVSGITRVKFFEYFHARDVGTGIRVGEVLIPDRHLALSSSLGVTRPPQSFQYVAEHKAKKILRGMSVAA